MPSDISGSTSNILLSNRNYTNETHTGLFDNNFSAINWNENPHNTWMESAELPEIPGYAPTVAILIISALAFVCCCFVLTVTYCVSGGGSTTLVYIRSLCLSDTLMSTYGISKMIMLLYINSLNVNFFLPESIFLTSTLASAISLLLLNIDCFLKLARPNKYKQVDKDTAQSIMLLMWNMSLVISFLPNVGWSNKDRTARFFHFYSWPYLLLIASLISVCLIACIVFMFGLTKLFNFLKAPGQSIAQTLQLQNYHQIHYTITAELVMWLMCYLPFFLYIGLTCPQCLISDYTQRDTTILYFIPVFIIKSLLSSALQAFRTIKFNLIVSTSQLLQEGMAQDPFSNGELTVSRTFTAPVVEFDRTSLHNNINSLNHNQITLHHNSNDEVTTDLTLISDVSTSGVGTTNLAYQPSLEFLQTISSFMQQTTSL